MKTNIQQENKKIGNVTYVNKETGRVVVDFYTGDDSPVVQDAKKECDINYIMKKFEETGQLPGMIRQNPEYGDYTDVKEYQESCNIVMKAEEQFAALPVQLRNRFANNPEKFLEWATDEKNRHELADLGMLKPEAVQESLKARGIGRQEEPKKEEKKKDEK